MSRRLLFTVVSLLLATSALAAVSYTWVSGGVSWSCTSTSTPRLFKCVSPAGRVVYITGDTETGCLPGDLDCEMEVTIKQDEGSPCFEPVESTPVKPEEVSGASKSPIESDPKQQYRSVPCDEKEVTQAPPAEPAEEASLLGGDTGEVLPEESAVPEDTGAPVDASAPDEASALDEPEAE